MRFFFIFSKDASKVLCLFLYCCAVVASSSRLFEDSGINILFVRPQEEDNANFREAVSEVTGGLTDYYNVAPNTENGGSIPTLELMTQYDCIMVHSLGGASFHNASLLGDLLADYVDDAEGASSSGVVVLSDGFGGGGFTYSSTSGLRGRIIEKEYSPVTSNVWAAESGSDYNMGSGTTLLYDGIYNATFSSIANNRDVGNTLQGNGIQDGSYEDGGIAAAYRPDFRVIYLGGSHCWGPDYPSIFCPGNDETFGYSHVLRWINACSVANVLPVVDAPSPPPTMTPLPSTPTPSTPTVPTLPTSFSEVLNILSDLYKSTDGPNWKNQDGWELATDDDDDDFCQWFGVSCNEEGNINSIYLEDNGLIGSISSDIWKLKELERLYLGKNDIWRIHFDGIEQASSLKDISILSTVMKETKGIEKAPALKYLDVSNNVYFTPSNVIEHVFRVTTLETLNISRNDFTKQPNILQNMSNNLFNLQFLYASYSGIIGTIPESIGQMVNLNILDLTGNRLEGGIFAQGGGLNELVNLTELLLGQQDNFGPGGGLPSFDILTHLRKLDLSGGSLSSVIPFDFLGGIENLEQQVTVDLSCNSIHGTLPEELRRFEYLDIDITGNSIEEIPVELCKKEGWIGGRVGLYGCDAIACPPGTCNKFGRQLTDDTPCSEESCDQIHSTHAFGATNCDRYRRPTPPSPLSSSSPAPSFIGCPCLNGGVCENESHYGNPLCRCPDEYDGNLCQIERTSEPTSVLKPCTLECYNKGKCVWYNDVQSCDCRDEFTGTYCEMERTIEPSSAPRPCTVECFNGGRCVFYNDVQSCDCRDEYTGTFCEIERTIEPTNAPVKPPKDGLDTVLLRVGKEVSERDPPLCFSDAGVCLKQEGSGNFILTKPGDSSCALLWESGYLGFPVHVFSTKLQNSGVLLTSRRGSLYSAWKTNEKGSKSKDYVLVLSGNQKKLSIKLDDIVLWEADTRCGVTQPTAAPVVSPTTGKPPPDDGTVLLHVSDKISDEEPLLCFTEAGVCLEQKRNGNFALITDDECVLWESGYTGAANSYYTKLSKKGVLITRYGDNPDSVWKTREKGDESDDYVLFLSKDHEKLSIKLDNSVLWEADTETCQPPVGGTILLHVGDEVTKEEPRICFTEAGVCLEQKDNGNFLLMKDGWCVLWESDFSGADNLNYRTRLSSSGVLITRFENNPNSVWKTESKGGKSDDYMLILSDDYKTLSIKLNGGIVWVADTNTNC